MFAADYWAIQSGTLIAFASAGIALLSSAAIFVPMVRTGRLRGRGLLVGGVFYLAYLALVERGSLAGLVLTGMPRSGPLNQTDGGPEFRWYTRPTPPVMDPVPGIAQEPVAC